MKNMYVILVFATLLAVISPSTLAQNGGNQSEVIEQQTVTDEFVLWLRNADIPEYSYLDIMKQVDLSLGIPEETERFCSYKNDDGVYINVCCEVSPPMCQIDICVPVFNGDGDYSCISNGKELF